MKRLLNNISRLILALLIVGLSLPLQPAQEVKAAYGDWVDVLNETFEGGSGNWTTTGNVTLDTSVKFAGSQSLKMTQSVGLGASHKIAVLDINSPYRDLVFQWYPQYSITSNNDTSHSFETILSLDEGAFILTNTAVALSWNGTNLYASVYEYADGSVTATNTSATIAVTNATWHKIEVTSNTTETRVLIDDVALTFGGLGYSTILTNGYHWVKYAVPSQTIISAVGGSNNSNTGYISGTVNRYKKQLYIGDAPSNIQSANVSITLDKDNTVVGSLFVYVNGVLGLTLTEADINNGVPNPGNVVYTYSIAPALLLQGLNEIVLYGSAGGNTNCVLKLSTTNTTMDRSWSSVNSGVDWTDTNNEYSIWLSISDSNMSHNVDNLVVQKNDIINTSDLFGRIYDQIALATLPGGQDNAWAIYSYLLTGNATTLAVAQSAADSIQTSYDGGNKNLPFVKEMALLSLYDPSRVTLVGNLADLLWTYKVNSTTKLPYYSINSAGAVTDNTTYVADPYPQDALDVVDSFILTYQTTNQTKYLNYAEAVLTGINTYMKNAVSGTIVTSANATTGNKVNTLSRVGDQVSNFIETALLDYSVSGNASILNMATYQADQYIAFGWDSTHSVFTYASSDAGFEIYVPSISSALVKLSEATGNTTYRTYAQSNFTNFLTNFRRNNLLSHYWTSTGLWGHTPSYISHEVPRAAGLLYRYTSDSSYLDLADEYMSSLVQYYLPSPHSLSIIDDSFALSHSLSYLAEMHYITEMFRRYVLPDSGVTVSWAFGDDLYGRYRGIGSFPVDVKFTRNSVTLNDVTGTGTIEFGDGIDTVYLPSPYDGVAWDVSVTHQIPYPPTMPTVVTGAISNITIEPNAATLSGNLTDMGVASDAYVYFEWGTLAYENSTPEQSVSGVGGFSANIAGFLQDTTLHARAVVRVGGVYSYGSDVTGDVPSRVDVFIGLRIMLVITPTILLVFLLFGNGIFLYRAGKAQNIKSFVFHVLVMVIGITALYSILIIFSGMLTG